MMRAPNQQLQQHRSQRNAFCRQAIMRTAPVFGRRLALENAAVFQLLQPVGQDARSNAFAGMLELGRCGIRAPSYRARSAATRGRPRGRATRSPGSRSELSLWRSAPRVHPTQFTCISQPKNDRNVFIRRLPVRAAQLQLIRWSL
jgi:hypothetical protein